MGFSNEFKVGLFVLATLVIVAFGFVWTYDGVRRDEGVYELKLSVKNADGLWPGTPIKLAGVNIGAIDDIQVVGERAHIRMLIRDEYELPVGTTADIAASGLLGDRYISLNPVPNDAKLGDGSIIELRQEPGNIDAITRQVEGITDDVKAITASLRELAENDSNREHVEATLANVEALSEALRLMAEANRHDVDAIVDSVRRLSESLEGIVADAGSDVDEELDKIKAATDTLQRALDDVESITGKVDGGQGTIGALINERETVDSLNDTIGNANEVIESFSGLRAKVYYVGRYYLGTQPNDPDAFFFGNPLHNTGSNTIGVELHPQEDFWYTFEFVDYPLGTVTYTEHFVPELGSVYTEWVRKPNYRFTFQFNKKWRMFQKKATFSFRLGVKDSGGGVGLTWHTLKDRLQFSADAFDFDLGSYPAVEAAGTPNVRIGARWEPIDHVFFEAGTEQPFLGLRYRYFSGYGGVGFHFDDDDIKLLFATLPLGSL